jgi:hypothetical protein
MELSTDHIEFLQAVAKGQMDEHTLQRWWDTHYKQLRESAPIWMLLRFLHGGRLAALVTLEDVGIVPDAVSPGTLPESEWQSCSDPAAMLESLFGTADERTLRQFAVRCCRRRVRWLTEEWREGIEVAERAADGQVTEADRLSTLDALTTHCREVIESDNGEIYAAKEGVLATFDPNPLCAAAVASAAALTSVFREREDEEIMAAEQRWQADLIRKLFPRQRLTNG